MNPDSEFLKGVHITIQEVESKCQTDLSENLLVEHIHKSIKTIDIARDDLPAVLIKDKSGNPIAAIVRAFILPESHYAWVISEFIKEYARSVQDVVACRPEMDRFAKKETGQGFAYSGWVCDMKSGEIKEYRYKGGKGAFEDVTKFKIDNIKNTLTFNGSFYSLGYHSKCCRYWRESLPPDFS